jgi:diacylglycerol kinase family enzyme
VVTQEKIGLKPIIKLSIFYLSNIRFIFTKKANDGTLITRKLLKKGYKNIVAVGGDGTINEVANGFFNLKPKNMQSNDYSKFRSESRLEPMNPKGVMYVVPSGSRNVLARSLELRTSRS